MNNLNYDNELQAEEPDHGDTIPNIEEEIRDALIAFCRLSPEAVQSINESMRASHLSFHEAAVHTGLVTEHEAADARAWVRDSLRRRETAVIETALRRRTGGGSQAVTVRHAGVGRPADQLVMAHRPDSPHSERIRALRTELLLLHENDRQAGCIAILSPCAAEGRSQLAAELAIAFAQLDRPTLLVDADLRKPAQQDLFALQSQWGLAQNLAFGQTSELFGVEGLAQLSIIPAGPPAPQPTELLAGDRLHHLIARWRHAYEFIFIDTPPVTQYSDAISVAAMASSAVVIGRARTTPYKQLKETVRRLALTQTRVLGAIISDF